jgi:FtsZ-binding cell division protein ZapB
MGWRDSAEASADRTLVPPTSDRTVVPTTGPALSPEMQAIMQQMQLLTAEIQGLREEVAQLRQENAQLKEQMNQQQAENAQLKTENAQLRAELEAYRSGKVKPGAEVSLSDGNVPPVATNDGATPQLTNPESTVAPQMEKREIPDLDAVVRTPFMNNLGRSEVNAILKDELKGYKEASETKEFDPGSREEFLNKVAKAYSGEDVKLNDLIKSDKELAWAEEIASTVENGGENGNGDNFPRTTKQITVQKSEEKKAEIEKTPEAVAKHPVLDETKTEPAKTEVETLSQPAQPKEEKSVDMADPKKDQLTPSEEKQPVVASENQMTPAQVKEMIRDFFQELEKNGYSLQKADVVVQKVASAEIETKTTKKKEQVQKKQETAKKLVEKTEKLSKKKDTLTKAQREFVQSHLGLQGIDLNQKQDGFVYKDDGQELSDYAIKQVVGHETKGKYATKTGLIQLFQKLHTLDKEVAAQYGFEFKEVKVAQATVKRSRKSSAVQKTQISKTTAEKSSTSQNVSGQMVDKFLKSSRN